MIHKGFKFAITTLSITLLLPTKSNCERDEWIWKKNNDEGTSRKIGSKYEIYEPNLEGNGPESPDVIPFRPGQLNRPGNYDPQREPSPHGTERHDVLVGPSYGRGPFEYVDKCSCTERFNCRGLAYGHCDVGRQYCCEGRRSGLPPSRPIHSPENGILVGPGGGGVPHPFHHGNRGGYGRGDYDGEVLVRPGGPTGHLGRPGKGSGFGLENGVLAGPNRNNYYHQGQYGRSRG
nr:uncharacterized protein LOC111421455 [Onthophagus taurus]